MPRQFEANVDSPVCERAAIWGYLNSAPDALALMAGQSYSVGRTPASDLVCDSRSVSKAHAVLEIDAAGRQAALRDLGSLNGCFINNDRLRGQRQVLTHGDNIRFGFDAKVWTGDCTERAYTYILVL